MSNKIVEVVTDKLDQLARDGLLATYGYSPFDAITRDKAGKLHVHTFPGVEMAEIIHYLEQYLRGEGIGSLEVYLVLDCRAGKGQGTTLTDVVAIIHCRARAYPYRIGIIEYDSTSWPVRKKPVNWHNQYWYQSLERVGIILQKALSDQFAEIYIPH